MMFAHILRHNARERSRSELRRPPRRFGQPCRSSGNRAIFSNATGAPTMSRASRRARREEVRVEARLEHRAAHAQNRKSAGESVRRSDAHEACLPDGRVRRRAAGLRVAPSDAAQDDRVADRNEFRTACGAGRRTVHERRAGVLVHVDGRQGGTCVWEPAETRERDDPPQPLPGARIVQRDRCDAPAAIARKRRRSAPTQATTM